MKGYKALDWDMRAAHGNKMQFELGKTYFVDGEVIPCKNGFHFCEKIEYLNCYYNIANSRIFEVEADGIIIRTEDKCVTERIKLVRELSKEEISKYFEQNLQLLICHNKAYIRYAVAEQGYGLNVLINDKNWQVREAVAKQGYGLDILIHDEDWCVREAVAKQGYGLDILIYDNDWCVREAVAKQGYGLDILINDKNWYVRQAVANQGYGLDVLINDKDWHVREAVVRQGYGLDGLVKDKERYASRTAKNMLNKNYQKKKLKSVLSRMHNRLSAMIKYMSDK